MIAARLALAILGWPIIYIVDRLRGCDPPARFRTGLDWALGRSEAGPDA